MIRFRTPGPIGQAELRAMNSAVVTYMRHHGEAIPPELVHELRVLGITIEWPTEPTHRVAVEGRVR